MHSFSANFVVVQFAYGTAHAQVYSSHWSKCVPHKFFCEARRVTRILCVSEQITRSFNYARELRMLHTICTYYHAFPHEIDFPCTKNLLMSYFMQ